MGIKIRDKSYKYVLAGLMTKIFRNRKIKNC